MIERSRSRDVIDFFWEWQKRQAALRHNTTVAELALNKCEETFLCCDWDGFGYWHNVYCRERGIRSTSSKRNFTR